MHTRRSFFFLSAAPMIARAQAKRKILVALFDGFGVDYLKASDTPNLKRMQVATAQAVIPTVTNVNNASLMTGSPPARHGITTNFYYDPKTGKAVQMESQEFLLRPTLIERAAQKGLRTALVSSKAKVRTLLGRGAHVALSAEKDSGENMYSAKVNYWSLRKAGELLKSSDVVYLSTTDYMMHTYAPEQAESLEHLHMLDKLMGEIATDHSNLEIYLTADHGMNAKTEAIDPGKVLARHGIEGEAVPIIKDKHQVHHQDLGGACYVYLKRPADRGKAIDILRKTEGCEEVYDREKAAKEFLLHADRIGDIFVLGQRHVAFGLLGKERETCKVRTHGSRHEAAVPVIVHGRKADLSKIKYNWELARLTDL